MEKAVKGDWVQVHTIVLQPEERVSRGRDELPLEMWTHGFLLEEESEIGDTVRVETMIGRSLEGILCERKPAYRHSFGETVPELLLIGKELRRMGREAPNGPEE